MTTDDAEAKAVLVDAAVGNGLWTAPGVPSEAQLVVLAFLLTNRSVPPPREPAAQRWWLLGCARRLGLMPWPANAQPAAVHLAKKGGQVDFYRSRAWRELRYKAILKYGRNCMCCGVRADPVHVDHIKPRSKYPELALDINNVQILCEADNLAKSAWDETDWRPSSASPSSPPASS